MIHYCTKTARLFTSHAIARGGALLTTAMTNVPRGAPTLGHFELSLVAFQKVYRISNTKPNVEGMKISSAVLVALNAYTQAQSDAGDNRDNVYSMLKR